MGKKRQGVGTMKVLLVWLLLSILACGAETIAWQVSLDRVVEGGVNSPKVVRLEGPPAESVFFEEGDELWDLMGAISIERWVPDDPANTGKRDPGKRVQGKFAGEWLVWNARSRRVVGRGGWDELEEIDPLLVYDQVKSTMVLKMNGRVEGSVATVCGSGERAEAKDGKLMSRVSPNVSLFRRFTDLNYEVEIDMGGGRRTEVMSAASIQNGREVTLAKWSEGGENYELIGMFGVVSEDGILMESVRQHEEGGRSVSLKVLGLDFWKYDGTTLKSGLKVGVFNIPPDFVCRIIEERAGSEFDFPPELARLSSGLYEDALEGLKANGVSFELSGSLALVNHSTKSLIAVNDQANLERIADLVDMTTWAEPAAVECDVRWDDQSRMLLARSGEWAFIRRFRGEEKLGSFEVAPNISEDNQEIDLHLSLSEPSHGVDFNTAVNVVSGESMDVGILQKEGGERKVTLSCEVIRNRKESGK